MSRKEERRKDWRKSGWARAAEAGLYAASRFHPAASLAYDGVGALTGFNTEKKYFDVQGSSILTNGYLNAGSGVQLTGITAGTAGDQRTGISVKLTDFQVRLSVTPVVAPTGNSYTRIILLFDREGNVVPNTPPAITDVLQDTSTALNRLLTPLNVTNFGRFQIMKDITLCVGGSPQSDLTQDRLDHDWTFGEDKLKDHHLLWATDDTSETRGHIYLFAFSFTMLNSGGVLTQDTTTNAQPFVSYWARSRFVDN